MTTRLASWNPKGPDDQWLAADEALSTPLPDGRVLWLWGDTIQSGGGFVRNSAILHDRGCFSVVKRGATEFIPNKPDGSWYWPSAAVTYGGKLYIFANHLRAGVGGFGFEPIGVDLARFGLPAGGEPAFESILPTPSSNAPQGDVQYGAAAVMRPDGYTYVFGTKFEDVPGQLVFGKAVYLARVPSGSLASPSAWRYRTSGGGWSQNRSKATQLVAPYPHGWSSSFTAYHSSSWVVITKENQYLGQNLISAKASKPWGPWTLTTLASIPSSGDPIVYTALAHPEQALSSGKLPGHGLQQHPQPTNGPRHAVPSDLHGSDAVEHDRRCAD